MYLKRVEIYGFKSFADKTYLEFEEGITAIVGPNGSGKSNIADAIRWVLGEQSVKSLRGNKMEDVIFSGTQERKPLGYAEVSLVIDNSSNILPIDYNEVRITRRVFRSGDSEFYINKTSCRLKDIHKLLMDTGLGKEGYSLIGQGKIDEILSANSEDRRYIFEEAAEIVKYKSRKEEAEKKLISTEENLVRIIDITNELENQIEPLLVQSEKAEEFLKLKELLKEKELAIFVHKVDSLKDKLHSISVNKKNAESQIKDVESEIENIENKINNYKQELKNLEDQISYEQNFLYNIESQIERSQSEIKLHNERNQYIKDDINRVSLEINNHIIDINKFNEEISLKEQQIDKLTNEFKELSSILKSNKDIFTVMKLDLKKKEKAMDIKRQSKIDIINELAELKSHMNGLNIMNHNITTQVVKMTERLNELTLNNKDNKKTKSQKIKLIDEIVAEHEELNSKKNILHLNNEEIIKKIESLQERYNETTSKIQIIQSKVKALTDMEREYEGYFYSVKKLMLEKKNNDVLKENIYGVIGELINVPSKYTLAIERALGSSIQHIVVKDEIIAKKCIRILTKNKWGRATFLPKEVIKGNKISKDLDIIKSHKGFIGLASDIITYDKTYKEIIQQLLGKVILVDKIEDGISLSRKLNHRYKIVSLNGVIFNPGGAMVGGSSTKGDTSVLNRKKEINILIKEIDVLKNNETKLKNDIKNLSRQKDGLSCEEEELIDKINNNQMEYFKLNNYLKQIKENILKTNKEIEKIQDEIKSFELESIELKKKEEDLREKINRTNDKLNLINSEININSSNTEEEKEKYVLLNEKITKLEIEIARIHQRKLELINQKKLINDSINENTEQIQSKKSKLENLSHQIEENNYKNSIKNKDIIKLSEKKKVSQDKIKLLIQNKNELNKKIEQEQYNLKEYNKQLLISNKALNKTIVQLNKVEMEMENIKNSIYEDYQITYNLALGYKKEIKNLNGTYTEIKDLKNRIRDLGAVNINAIEEYKRIKERHTFLSKQREDLEIAKNNLYEIIRNITSRMEKQFLEQFNIIGKEFNNVFKELFQGGYAKIYLSEPDNVLSSGIVIEVQPSGKKFQNLSLLSGGERALTAIALLFAILRVKPTPFCILDEIEASLDDPNALRYATFLKEFSKSTQFVTITHRKRTMEIADILYGITMEDQGVSKLISVKLTELAS